MAAAPISGTGFGPRRPIVIAPRRGPGRQEVAAPPLRNLTTRDESPDLEEEGDEEEKEQEIREQSELESEEEELALPEIPADLDEEIEDVEEKEGLEPEEEQDDLIRLRDDEDVEAEEKADEIVEAVQRKPLFAVRSPQSMVKNPESAVEEEDEEEVAHLFGSRDITYEDLLALERPVKHVEVTEDEFVSGVYGGGALKGVGEEKVEQERSELEPLDTTRVEEGLEEVTLPVRCVLCGISIWGYQGLVVKMRREGFRRGEDEDVVNTKIVAEINRQRRSQGLTPLIGCCVDEIINARAVKNTQLSIEEVVDGIREVVPEEPIQIERLLLTGNSDEVIKQTISAKNYLEARNQIQGLWSEPGAEPEEEEVKEERRVTVPPVKKAGLTRITLKPTVAIQALKPLPAAQVSGLEIVRKEGELFDEAAALAILQAYFKRLRSKLPTAENPTYIEFRNVPKELNNDPTVRFYANSDAEILGKDKTERLAPTSNEQRALAELEIPYQIFYPVGGGMYVPRVVTKYQLSERDYYKRGQKR